MQNDLRILVFIPTYNDAEEIAKICEEIRALTGNYSILVIDDGSDPKLDDSELDDDVLRYRLPANFGLGTCTHIAFDQALRHGYDMVVRVDGDGQHPTHEIPNLVGIAQLKDVDFVAAVRSNQQRRPGITGWPAVAIKWYYSLMARWLTSKQAPGDVNTGFFCANRQAAALINKYQLERFPEPQMYIVACRRGLKVDAVTIAQQPRRTGKSTLGFGQAVRMFYRFNIFALSEILQRPDNQ